MSRLSFFLALGLLQAFVAGTSRGQTFYFSDGRKASMPEAKIKGLNIVMPLKIAGTEGGSAELTLPISSLSRIDWPAPPVLVEAEADLAAGRPADALKKIDGPLVAQEIFRDVPGSWWNQGAVIKAIALARLAREEEADVLLERLRRTKAVPEDISRVEVAIIDQLVSAGKIDAVNARLEKLQSTVTDDSGLAAIALTKGRLFERAGKSEEALLSYLRVPVLYPAEMDMQPAALLGAATAYKKLGDETRAAATLQTLATRFPNSPEAAQSRR